MLKGYSKSDNEFARKWCLKHKSIDYLGGQCLACGDTTLSHYEFHHTGEKDGNISTMLNKGKSWTNIKKELDECNLLCANCHGELHCQGTSSQKNRKYGLLKEIGRFCCEKCGYNKNSGCLVFHHRDPSKKSFSIGHALSRKNGLILSDFLEEMSKCILLCKNCHREAHFDIGRYNRLLDYIRHKMETYKERKYVDYQTIRRMAVAGERHCDIAREVDLCQTTVRVVINRMKSKGEI